MRKTQNDLIYIGKDQPFDGEKLEAQLQSLYQAAVQGRDVREICWPKSFRNTGFQSTPETQPT